MDKMQEFKDSVSRQVFGKTKAEAVQSGKCIDCGEEALPKCYSDAGRKEFQISGLCEVCFDRITKF